MKEFGEDEGFSDRHMRRKLIEHYGDDIIFSSQFQKSDVVIIPEALSVILKQFHQRPKFQDEETEKRSILQTAARIIRHDVMNMKTNVEFYPLSVDIESVERNLNYLPDSLLFLLQKTMQGKDELKVAAIGQALMQATRPRQLLSPIQVGLGVQLHHQFGSRFLVDTLNSLGYCISYAEVQRYETSAAYQKKTNINGLTDGSLIQYSADNVDHNSCTLDGKGTFHGMGIIASVTPAINATSTIPRTSVCKEEVKAGGSVEVKVYLAPSNKFNAMKFNPLPEMNIVDNVKRFDLMPSVLWPLRTPMPGWSGIMQMCQTGNYPGKTSVTFLPMIDMSPSDPTCIYSTMHFVVNHARNYGATPILTFDQPLFWKASVMVANEPDNSPLKFIVLRLGGFHMKMSFLGSIGHIMRGSGLQEVIEQVYAANAVDHILSGKAVSRAVRAHFLVDTALTSLLINHLFGVALPLDNESHPNQTELSDAESHREGHDNPNITASEDRKLLNDINKLMDLVLSGEISVEAFCDHHYLEELDKKITNGKKTLKDHRTAQLWFVYTEMISILKRFIRAERTGNWKLHVYCVRAMLPYFAASGHNLYLKSAYFYLMNMLQLEEKHPEVYGMFMAGHHVLRRSDRFWGGLSTDLVIEQVLMRSLKSSGGLTRGRGMTEVQRARWIQAMPVCAEINNSMQGLTNVGFQTNDQHKESSSARQDRDSSDTSVILHFLQDRNPFVTGDKTLRHIETGAIADPSVNCERTVTVGENILKSMEGQQIFDFSFRKSNQVKTMDTKVGVKINNDVVKIDPQLLFQRLIAAARLESDDISTVFQYELSSVPSSLFDENGFPREANKPQIAEAIWKMGDCGVQELPSTVPVYILDGGSLLQRIPWTKGDTFSSICKTYVEYVSRRYKEAVIVFDGYKSQYSTKDITHLRRSKGIMTQRVHFTEDMPCRSKKETFLSNQENKQDFLDLLSIKFNEVGYKTIQAQADADKLIVLTSVQYSSLRDVVVIGEDTDLLILLLYYVTIENKDVFFKSDNSKGKTRIWDIKKAKSLLGQQLSSVLPVIHAITGCDTTSRIYGVGKGAALKKVASDIRLLDLCKLFLRSDVDESHVVQSGKEIIKTICGGVEKEDLNKLRFRRFTQRTATSTTCVQVQSLPPTNDASRFHSKRVYLQVQDWVNTESSQKPEDWGWYVEGFGLAPIRSSMPPAPEQLLKVIRCSCKQGCDTKRCVCRKHGLDCSVSCGDCRGVSCANSRTQCENTPDMEQND